MGGLSALHERGYRLGGWGEHRQHWELDGVREGVVD